MNVQSQANPQNLSVVVVPNPAEYAERMVNPTIKSVRTLRDDPFGQMHDRHQVSDAQYEAGRQWQRDYEEAGPRMKSSGFLAEPVDGGNKLSLGISDSQIKASRKLVQYANVLGADGDNIIRLVLADKLSLREVANRRHGDTSASTMKYVGRRFRECLDTLANAMGLAS